MTGTWTFEGQSAIVTGAGSGIGKAVALALATAGARVLAVDINGDAATTTANEATGIQPFKADVADREQVMHYAQAAAEHHGPPLCSLTTPASRECINQSLILIPVIGSGLSTSTSTACSGDCRLSSRS